MTKKTLWFDIETTGLNPTKHGVIQFAALIEIDGQVVDKLEVKMQPQSGAEIEQSAIDTHGMTKADIAGFMPHEDGYDCIRVFFERNCDKFDKKDKFYPAGYNVRFDLDFLQAMFKRFDRFGIGSFVNWLAIDPLPMLYMMDYAGLLSLPDYKLATVCAHYGIKINAHDALSDIIATRELTRKLITGA